MPVDVPILDNDIENILNDTVSESDDLEWRKCASQWWK